MAYPRWITEVKSCVDRMADLAERGYDAVLARVQARFNKDEDAAEFAEGTCVLIAPNGSQVRADTVYGGDAGRWIVAFRLQDGQVFKATGSDLVEALNQVREQLEPLGFIPAVNGARRNAHATDTARSDGGGTQIYLLEMGKPLDVRNLSGTMYAAPTAEVSTLIEQDEWLAVWRQSVGDASGKRPAPDNPAVDG